MAEVVLLGTGRALPSPAQENTYMVLEGESHNVMVDCGGSPYRRLLRAGVAIDRLDSLILTHSHPDHTYGAPALLMSLWLAGRRAAFHVYGLERTCNLLRVSMEQHLSERWPDMFEVHYHTLAGTPGALAFDSPDFEVTTAEVHHMVPTLGVRVLSHASHEVLAYSADTEPGPGVVSLARAADLLLHEATGEWEGHSSAAQAGRMAEEAGARRLVLVHYDADETPPQVIERLAREQYAGEVYVAADMDRFAW